MMLKNKIYGQGLLALFSGVFGAWAFPPYDLFFLGVLSYASLFVLIHFTETKRHAALIGFLWSVAFHVSGLWWIGNSLLVEGNPYRWAYPLAVLGLPLLLSLLTLVFCLLYKALTIKKPLSSLLSAFIFALFFSSSEWIRGHILTGFPWNLPAYIWSDHLEILQSLSILGAYGVSTLTLFLSVSLGQVFIDRTRYSVISALMLSLCFVGLYGWGAQRLEQAPPYSPPKDVMIRIVQPNIAQAHKWNPEKYLDHLNVFKHLSLSHIPETDASNVILIFPETALNDTMMSTQEARDIFRDISKAYKKNGKELFVLTGALRSHIAQDNTQNYYNSALLYGSDGYIIDDYDKSHLVPFGEYMPFSNIVDIAPIVQFSGFTAGNGAKTIHHKDLPSLSVAICYEIIFPRNLVNQADRPDLLVTLTNDAWYGDTAGPYQHYMMARYRAIEEHMPVLRAANTGISGAFDSYGREIKHLALGEKGVVDLH